MQAMTFDSAAADIGSRISDNGYQGLQSAATASNALSSLLPAGGDEISAQAVLAFASDAAEMFALHQAAQQELMRAGATISDIARMYADVDATVAGNVMDIGLRWGSRMVAV